MVYLTAKQLREKEAKAKAAERKVSEI